MTNQILEYLGKSHANYIHAGGKLASNKMFELLEPQEDEKILEIGFGTGATLVLMAAQSKAQFFGYELSPLMYQKALKRIQFCKMFKRINLTLLENKNHFPTPDNTFDRIYIESIIAIQEGSDFRNLLFEIKRVLKQNGVLLFNETIWLETTSKNKAEWINEECKKSFGIIQSNHEYLHVANWKSILTEIGFESEFEIPVSEIHQLKKEKISGPILRSKVFTLIGKTKASVFPTMRRNWKNFQLKMDSIMNGREKLMEGIIIKACNKK